MKNKLMLYGILSSAILAAVLFFVFLPPINPTNFGFWMFLWISLVPFMLCISLDISKNTNMKKQQVIYSIFGASVAIVLIVVLSNLQYSRPFTSLYKLKIKSSLVSVLPQAFR